MDPSTENYSEKLLRKGGREVDPDYVPGLKKARMTDVGKEKRVANPQGKYNVEYCVHFYFS